MIDFAVSGLGIAKSVSNLVLSIGDIGTGILLLVLIALVSVTTILVTKRFSPTEQTITELTDFVEVCISALKDAHLTDHEKIQIAKEGIELLATLKKPGDR